MESFTEQKWKWFNKPRQNYFIEFFGTFGLMTAVGLGSYYAPDLTPVIVGSYFAVLIFILGRIADIHMNPLVSWTVWVLDSSQLSYMDSTIYIALQYFGAMLGGIFIVYATGKAVNFQPVPPYTAWACFLAESIFGGILCFTALALPDISCRGGLFGHITVRAPLSHQPLSSSPLSSIDEAAVLKSNKHEFLTLSRRKSNQMCTNFMLFKGSIFGIVLLMLMFCCKGISRAALNPALFWGGSTSVRVSGQSSNFWLFVPYSLGPYISATLVGLLFRAIHIRNKQIENWNKTVSCEEAGLLVKSEASFTKTGFTSDNWAE